MKSFNPESHLLFRGGGTKFAPAIMHCRLLLQKYQKSGWKNVFVFMSDGDCVDPEQAKVAIEGLANTIGSEKLISYFLAYGLLNPTIEQMAQKINGIYWQEPNTTALRDNFLEISSECKSSVAVIPSRK